ncbi:MAG: coproporphyrinogen III oxidase, partial [Psychroflexus maritimus]
TTTKAKKMIGLGVSSISDSWFGFAQNEKDLNLYYQHINKGQLPVFRGHDLTEEDLIIRQHILNLMCNFETTWSEDENYVSDLKNILIELSEMAIDNLVILSKNNIKVTTKGKAFIRNICMAFDLRLKANKPEQRLFSMTI